MNLVLPRKVESIEAPFVIACEGFGDVCLVAKLLELRNTGNCRVGCPSREGVGGDGKDALGRYLDSIALAAAKAPSMPLKGLLVLHDADDGPERAFANACAALTSAEYPVPDKPFEPKLVDGFKVAVYLIPGKGEIGTLEHLLLRAAFGSNAGYEACVDAFLACINKTPLDKPNRLAKMRLSALVAGAFPNNPWATPGTLLLSSDNDLVPLDSPRFNHLADFLAEFCTE